MEGQFFLNGLKSLPETCPKDSDRLRDTLYFIVLCPQPTVRLDLHFWRLAIQLHSYVARVAYLLYNIAQHGVALKMRSVINDPVKTDMRRMYVLYNYLLRKKKFHHHLCCVLPPGYQSRNLIANSANEVIGHIINDPAKTDMRRVCLFVLFTSSSSTLRGLVKNLDGNEK